MRLKMPNRKRMLEVGISLILVSVIVFSVSAYFISQDTYTYTDNHIAAGGSPFSLSVKGISQGDDLEYSVTMTSASPNVTIYWLSPLNTTFGNKTVTTGSTASTVFVAPVSGNWTFVAINHANATANATITLGDISYTLIYSVVFGFVLLPAGIAFIGLYFYIRRHENVMKKMFERELR